jgi:hypothetical protein
MVKAFGISGPENGYRIVSEYCSEKFLSNHSRKGSRATVVYNFQSFCKLVRKSIYPFVFVYASKGSDGSSTHFPLRKYVVCWILSLATMEVSLDWEMEGIGIFSDSSGRSEYGGMII